MIRVAVISNTHERCGIGQYGRDLAAALRAAGTHVLLGEENPAAGAGLDAAILNYHPARVAGSAERVRAIRRAAHKVILIHHNSLPGGSFEPWFFDADRVVTHEPVAEPHIFIPMGIPEVSGLPPVAPEFTIGTAGFPFPWKRFDVLVTAAERLNARLMMVAPQHDFYDSSATVEDWRRRLGGLAEIVSEWLPTEDVVRKLARSWVNVFWFGGADIHEQMGQTGSARLGVAARRPVVISAHRKFRTFIPGDFMVADHEADVYRLLTEIRDGRPAPCPEKTFAQQRWSEVAQRFLTLIQGET